MAGYAFQLPPVFIEINLRKVAGLGKKLVMAQPAGFS
jgi:hypothetical protein